MEYIKKEELIKNKIYKANLDNSIYIFKLTENFQNCININLKIPNLYKNGNFTNYNMFKYSEATSEEKHWLNECIKLDKFITFDEAMKTFIPEYVECTENRIGSDYIKDKNYKVKENGYIEGGFALLINNKNRFKPSTKEAYDNQFIVKEPEFVLPEKWCIKRIPENTKVLNTWENNRTNSNTAFYNSNNCSMVSNKKYYYTTVESILGYTEITFEQFKKYVLKKETVEEKVIEPLPQFKIIETIETITKVENNEGNQFFIGDVVISWLGNVQTIKSFKYNKDKTEIRVVTDLVQFDNHEISINNIEHYIEPKVKVKTITLPSHETLLEKAKRLYPIGTKFKSATSKILFTIKDHIKIEGDLRNITFGTIEINQNGNYYGCVHSKEGKWAEIIK